MALNFKLNGTAIEEPIGFDNFSIKLERSKMHGIAAEYSDDSLEFYGDAIEIIEEAYNEDVDTEITFVVEDENGNNIYTGALDLSTYEAHDGEYHTISCKVGEIGVKTQFNNRTDVSINLNDNKTFNGTAIAHRQSWKMIDMPKRSLPYQAKIVNETGWTNSHQLSGHAAFMTLQFLGIKEDGSEYEPKGYSIMEQGESGGEPTNIFRNYTYQEMDHPFSAYFASAYSLDHDWYQENVLGVECVSSKNLGLLMDLDVDINVSFQTNFDYYLVELGIYSRSSAPAYSFDANIGPNSTCYAKVTKRIYEQGPNILNLHLGDFIRNAYPDTIGQELVIGIAIFPDKVDGYQDAIISGSVSYTLNQGSFSTVAFSDLNSTFKIRTSLIHDALNHVVEGVSENQLTVKSDFYGSELSQVNPTSDYGGGALIAIQNGYNIRNKIENGCNVSFKDLLDALNAIHCAGWGFSKENGNLYIRVEPWKWFYKYNVLLTITDAKEVISKLELNDVITRLEIGYKSYTDEDDYSLTDNIHSERKFTSTTTAISKDESVLCDFVADNYAIEGARRNAMLKHNNEYKYDDKIFVFALTYNTDTDEYECAHDIDHTNDSSILMPDQLINGILSPTRMGLAWIQYIFSINGLKPLKFEEGKINSRAAFVTKQSAGKHKYLEDPSAQIAESYVKENMDLALEYGSYEQERVMDAENIEFTYPLTRAQLNTIRNNPYGLISVNGILGWIKSLKYDFVSGETQFVLIKKHNQSNQ